MTVLEKALVPLSLAPPIALPREYTLIVSSETPVICGSRSGGKGGEDDADTDDDDDDDNDDDGGASRPL